MPARSILSAGLVLATLLAPWGCARQAELDGSISPGQLLRELSSSDPPLVLDVRTPAEYGRGHVPGARNVPHTAIREQLEELSGARAQPVVVYCERGGRARAAESVLHEAGFRVLHLEGDMAAWRAAGRPTEGP